MSEISDAKLLVIDDDPMNREILFRHLKNLGYSDITLTDGGKSGLEIVASNSIDLILLDMMMPVMNGLETLTHLKDTPIQG
ncbi:MAG: response regulator [Pseudanabaena sp. Salubria-1]|nr:response regulator [Pseudanabaena sp. Salubria-1]